MPTRVISSNFILQRAIDQLSKYYSIPSLRELSETIGLREISGLTNSVSSTTLRPSDRVVNIIDSLVNSSLGALPATRKIEGSAVTDSYYDLISELVTGGTTEDAGNREDLRDLSSKIQILLSLGDTQQSPLTETIIQNKMHLVLGTAATTTNNLARKISAINIKFPQVSLNQKFSEAITLFLNALPTIEISRAVPYVEITFIFNRQALDENGRLNAPSFLKFLEGSADISGNSTAKFIVEANRVESSATNSTGLLSLAGMELFNSPQTLTNLNSTKAGELRPVSVKDPFRPFMTFKNLNIDVAPSVGMFSFKTAKLSFVLHDASRVHEIAEFIKPDLYSTTEILIEYGWKHPDGDRVGNPYADLMNASRQKEKYGIRNIQLSLDESRQANINLDLFTKGATDLATETISSSDGAIGDVLRTIQRLSEAVQSFSSRFGNRTEGSSRTPEIRGIQFLNAASDWQGLLNLSSGDLDNFRNLQNTLQRESANSQQAADLRNTLSGLLGNITNVRGRATLSENGGAVTQLRQTIAMQIASTLRNLSNEDPYTENVSIPDREGRTPSPINAETTTRGRNSQERAGAARSEGRPNPNAVNLPRLPEFTARRGSVSLAKILLTFVGVPLAATGKFEEVQFLFYPFNPYAGNASKYTTGQFLVDINYFYEKYTQFRVENIARSANVSLQDFVSFIASVMIDDPVAPIYGIDSLYDRITNRATGETQYVVKGNEIQYQTSLERRMRGITPDGSFKMPQVSFYVEALPIRRGIRESSNVEPDISKTIVRIHVFDKQTTPYAGQAAILQAAREGVIEQLSQIGSGVDTEASPVTENHRRVLQEIISRAVNQQILEPLNPKNDTGMITYQIRGGQTAIKNFLMHTMPYAIYGTQNTGIISAQLSTIQDPALSTVNMLRSNNGSPLRSNGEQPGGLPLSIVPCELSMETIGCPLFSFGQQMFLDFGTGTSMDNVYGVSGLSHVFEPGSFKTTVKMVPFDAYGKYASFTSRVNRLVTVLDHNIGQPQSTPANANGSSLSTTPGRPAVRRGR